MNATEHMQREIACSRDDFGNCFVFERCNKDECNWLDNQALLYEATERNFVPLHGESYQFCIVHFIPGWPLVLVPSFEEQILCLSGIIRPLYQCIVQNERIWPSMNRASDSPASWSCPLHVGSFVPCKKIQNNSPEMINGLAAQLHVRITIYLRAQNRPSFVISKGVSNRHTARWFFRQWQDQSRPRLQSLISPKRNLNYFSVSPWLIRFDDPKVYIHLIYDYSLNVARNGWTERLDCWTN